MKKSCLLFVTLLLGIFITGTYLYPDTIAKETRNRVWIAEEIASPKISVNECPMDLRITYILYKLECLKRFDYSDKLKISLKKYWNAKLKEALAECKNNEKRILASNIESANRFIEGLTKAIDIEIINRERVLDSQKCMFDDNISSHQSKIKKLKTTRDKLKHRLENLQKSFEKKSSSHKLA